MRLDQNNPSDALARRLIVNVLAGIAVMYGVTIAICLPSLSTSTAAGVAALPAVFAGPFVGGLATMVMSAHAWAAAPIAQDVPVRTGPIPHDTASG